MKTITKILAVALAFAPCNLFAAPLTGTAGSNLTAFHGASGALNNNQWNEYTNVRSAPAADFGNCNALILRCAQPKCANGGCTTMEIAYPIVYGCVMANENCKSHGDALIQTLAAQLVANSNAKANEQAANAQAAASSQAAQQSEQQLMQMQMQLQQMQQQMESQNAQAMAAQQAAIEEQRRLVQQQAEEAARQAEAARVAQQAAAPAQQIAEAANMGVSADTMAREQIGGQILTQLENADVSLKTLKQTMQNAFDYAGCDASGNNCTGPKRVSAFKSKVSQFFDPYENVLDEVYDALILAQSLGVDITDIYMMLNGSCNVWGQYMCESCKEGEVYTAGDVKHECVNGYFDVAKDCSSGQCRVNANQHKCTLLKMLTDQDTVQQNWLEMGMGSSGGVRVACASDALDNSMLFRNRKKQASIDMETLRRIVEQDSLAVLGRNMKAIPDATKYCSVDADGREELQRLVGLRRLPDKVCVSDGTKTGAARDPNLRHRSLSDTDTTHEVSQQTEKRKEQICETASNKQMCLNCIRTGGDWTSSDYCLCPEPYNTKTQDGRCSVDGAYTFDTVTVTP